MSYCYSSKTVETIFTFQDLRDTDIVTNDDNQPDIEVLDDAFYDIIYALDDVSNQECAVIDLPETFEKFSVNTRRRESKGCCHSCTA